jgi:hypothetical protein
MFRTFLATCPPARKAAHRVPVSSWAAASSATAADETRRTSSTIGKTRIRLHCIQVRPVAILTAIELTGPSRVRQQAKQAMSNDLRDERRRRSGTG